MPITADDPERDACEAAWESSSAGNAHEVFRANHFSQEDVGEQLATGIIGFVRRFPRAERRAE